MHIDNNGELKSESPYSGKPDICSNEILRKKFREVLYKNSSDDTECLRIKFEKVDYVIDLLVNCVG